MQKLRVASCQFPVTQDVDRNAEYVGRQQLITPVFQLGFFCGPSRRNDCSTAAKESSRYARS